MVPFTVYADFICILQPIDKKETLNLNIINIHTPVSYAHYIKCAYDNSLDKFVLETIFNSGMNFLLSLKENLTFIYENYISKPVPIVMSDVEEDDFKKPNNCHTGKNRKT